MSRTLRFIGIEGVRDETVAAAVEFARFESMRKLERHNALEYGVLAPTDQHDEQSYKTRRGEVGSHIDELNRSDREYVNALMQERLSPGLGYAPCRGD